MVGGGDEYGLFAVVSDGKLRDTSVTKRVLIMKAEGDPIFPIIE